MAIGWVKWFSERRHFGFILSQDGVEIFVHRSAIRDVDRPPREGDEVIFLVRGAPKGLQAVEVIKIAGADRARFRGLYGPRCFSRAPQAPEPGAAGDRSPDEPAREG